MKYFTIEELSKSTTAIKHGINNIPDMNARKNMETLIEKLLDPLREKIGMSIMVNSGYRSPKVNSLVGGSATSQHCTGQAADIQTAGDKYNKLLFELAKTMDFDQLIWEYGNDLRPDWVHVSYVSKEKNRHQILRAKKISGKTKYIPMK